MKRKLLGRRVRVTSNNEGYDNFRDKILIITHVAYSKEDHPGYDSGLGTGEALCDFKTEDGEDIGSSLYEYEFKVL